MFGVPKIIFLVPPLLWRQHPIQKGGKTRSDCSFEVNFCRVISPPPTHKNIQKKLISQPILTSAVYYCLIADIGCLIASRC